MKKYLIAALAALFFVLCAGSCKKDPTVNYSQINVSISLLEYTYGLYAHGTWSTATKARFRGPAGILDSVTSLLPAFNPPQSTPVSSPCNANLRHLTHSFKVQTNSVNTLEIYDLTGTRITYDIYPSAVYFSSSGDSTTLELSEYRVFVFHLCCQMISFINYGLV